jgi:hypothetical protein
MIIQASGPMHECGQHSVFVERAMVRVGMQIEVLVCVCVIVGGGFAADSKVQ